MKNHKKLVIFLLKHQMIFFLESEYSLIEKNQFSWKAKKKESERLNL